MTLNTSKVTHINQIADLEETSFNVFRVIDALLFEKNIEPWQIVQKVINHILSNYDKNVILSLGSL